MPFCPKCKHEYGSGARSCPHCGSPLRDPLPQTETPSPPDFTQIELCTVDGEIHAKLIQRALASEGIPSRLDSPWPFRTPLRATGLPFPFGGGFDATVRVMVNRSDLDRARIVYEDFEVRDPSLDDEATSDQ